MERVAAVVHKWKWKRNNCFEYETLALVFDADSLSLLQCHRAEEGGTFSCTRSVVQE